MLEASYDSNPSFLPDINLLHTSFPLNPLEEYRNQAEYILTELGLVELWVTERKRLDRAPTSIRDKPQESIPNEVNKEILSNAQNPVNKRLSQNAGPSQSQI